MTQVDCGEAARVPVDLKRTRGYSRSGRRGGRGPHKRRRDDFLHRSEPVPVLIVPSSFSSTFRCSSRSPTFQFLVPCY
jgi:hypothetical protein